ncbi:MAG TPA: FMN-binding protein [Devosiaceae bacterium]|jgi:uncharacterized protein with FMN-binding domain|nr:FMN-binding protein [Devosiaceae bacterium]
MKKLLLSAAVIAASGVYVIAENRAPDLPSASSGKPTSAIPAPSSLKPPGQSPADAAAAPSQLPGVAVPISEVASPASMGNAVPQAPLPDAGTVEVADITPPQLPESGGIVTDIMPQPQSRPAFAAPLTPTLRVAQAGSSTASPGAYRDGSYKGPSADAYYGRVQVDAVVKGGRIDSIEVLAYPNDRSRSRRISAYALPSLEQEVVQAQSANIDIVSGATLTSEAYIRSLKAALSSAQQ